MQLGLLEAKAILDLLVVQVSLVVRVQLDLLEARVQLGLLEARVQLGLLVVQDLLVVRVQLVSQDRKVSRVA